MFLLGKELSFNSLYLAAGVAILTICYTWLSNRRIVRALNKLAGPPTKPFVGNALDFFVAPEERIEVLKRWYKIYGSSPVIRIWIGNRPVIALVHATSVEVILSSTKHIDKSYEYSFVHPWLGTGLLTSTGSKWQSRRKLLTPAFHFKILEDFLHVFNEQSNIFVHKVEEESERSEEGFDIFPFVTRFALDAICDAAMGKHVNAQEKTDSDYLRAVFEIGAIVQDRQLLPWLQPDILFRFLPLGFKQRHYLNTLHGFTDQVIAEKRAEVRDEKISGAVRGKRLAFLDMLLNVSDENGTLSDADIREEVDTFMFEGHDTTAAGIGWCLFLLGHHPEALQKVHEELDKVFSDDPDRVFTMRDLTELKYLECAIKESQRLYPSVPLIGRSVTEDVTIEGQVIPSGATVLILPHFVHRDSKYFPDPEKFDPSRFTAENTKGRHPYAFIPFSAGPRNCIGQKFALMEEKVVIGSLLRKFSITSLEKREDVPVLIELVTRPKNGFKVKLQPR